MKKPIEIMFYKIIKTMIMFTLTKELSKTQQATNTGQLKDIITT